MICRSNPTTLSCIQPMSTKEHALWGIAGITIIVIVVSVNWWARAMPSLPPFTHF